ncbi:MAG: type II toxin-antitoxin system antitoxin, RelB/DinJ family [Burkholderiaceae bacterium]|nr:MAG: type II toxin-antitoxin system antitoxin, RelB/DinJ family [Burkholderiaceae bacterium]
MGLTVFDAVRRRLTKVTWEKALPFEPLIPNATTIRATREARAGKVTKAADLDALFAGLSESERARFKDAGRLPAAGTGCAASREAR